MKYAAMKKDTMQITLAGGKGRNPLAAFASKRQLLFWNEADAAELPQILQIWIDRHLEKVKAA